MKHLLFIFLLSIPFVSIAQKEITQDSIVSLYKSLIDSSGNYSISEVVHLDTSFSKDYLYRNAKDFFTNYFKSGKDVIQYDDREEGKIIGKGVLEIHDSRFLASLTWDVGFSLEILCKDGKYKYHIYDINIREEVETSDDVVYHNYDVSDAYSMATKGMGKKVYSRLFVKMYNGLVSTGIDFKNAMSKKEEKDNF